MSAAGGPELAIGERPLPAAPGPRCAAGADGSEPAGGNGQGPTRGRKPAHGADPARQGEGETAFEPIGFRSARLASYATALLGIAVVGWSRRDRA